MEKVLATLIGYKCRIYWIIENEYALDFLNWKEKFEYTARYWYGLNISTKGLLITTADA